MADKGSPLAVQFFGKPLADCSAEELQAAAEKYPYVGALQLMWLSRPAPDTAQYAAQYQRSMLYFPTPAHLHFALHQQPDVADEEPAASAVATETILPAAAAVPLSESSAAQHEASPENTPELLPATDGIISPQTAPEPNAVLTDAQAAPAAETELSFEPYHTVDYFASQGIKLSKEEVGTDKFGKQLKSFTEWLKTMKRLPATQVPAAADAQAEKGVDGLAEKSVADAQVLTESMAEVWEKQGALDKAKEVYHKLSLLHPSKRAYFAAKIEALKEK